ncbi:hypothetical protein XM25_18790 [Devosia sp. H5989]|nr:hypothetical protein XM25_18790 [Devosia sp. H5989]
MLRAKMRDSIRYRGRDGENEWIESSHIGLFHSRLSIVDLVGGAQPISDTNNRYVIVFNGEIYNFKELRQEYEALGARFRTLSDTEVVLEGFRLKGPDVCLDLNGMFAFAVWDAQDRRLFIARDRLGKKPLYWTILGGSFFFSSTLDAFRDLPGWTGDLSRIDLDTYATVGDFRPGYTVFKQGRSLRPATYAIVDLNGDLTPRETTYWQLDFSRRFHGTFDDALSAFEALIADAISIRLRADVPLALTFSGGVDSGIIAAVAAKRLDSPLSCWTIDYDAPDDPSEEVAVARRVADHLGLDWHFSHFDYHSNLVPSLREALIHVDQPCRHLAIGYSARLYAAIRPQATVVLSGNGADELFLGYSGNEVLASQEALHRVSIIDRIFPSRSARTRRSRSLAQYQSDFLLANLGRYPGEDTPESVAAALKEDIMTANVGSFADLYSFMALRYYTCDPNYRIPDIAGLSHQVEVRSPFLDYRVVEFALSLPIQFKIGNPTDGTQNKRLLKQYYSRFVPDDVAWARKKGMGANLRYDKSLAEDAALLSLYDSLMGRIVDAGLPVEAYKVAAQTYQVDMRKGFVNSAAAGTMSTGLMLGLWLETHYGN